MPAKKHIIQRAKLDGKLQNVFAIGDGPGQIEKYCESLKQVSWNDDLQPHLEGNWTHVLLFAEASDFNKIFDSTVLWEDKEEGFQRDKMSQVGKLCNWDGCAFGLCDQYLRVVSDKSKWLLVDTTGSGCFYWDRLSWL